MEKLVFMEFFKTRIGQAINETLKNILKSAKNAGGVVIFLSRKGYWLYRIYRLYAEWDDELCRDVIIVSDRYIVKWYESDWNGRRIYIIDDSITTGFSMLNAFERVSELYPNAVINCMAIFMRLSKLELKQQLQDKIVQKENDESAEVRLDNFLNHLKIFEKISAGDIGKLAYDQVYLFQKIMVPYVIDLPQFRYKFLETDMSEKHNYAVVNKDMFYKLQQIYGDWICEDNSYVWDCLIAEKVQTEKIGSCFFRYTNPNIYNILGDMLFDIVIKCRYEQKEDNDFKIVLTPFAIINSIPFDEAAEIALNLYEGTRFGEWLNNEEGFLCEKEHSVLLFRSIVYFLSLYGWVMFKNEVEECIGISLPTEINASIMSENSKEIFVETVKEMCYWKRENYQQKLSKLSMRNNINRGEGSEQSVLSEDDMKNAYICIYRKLIEQKRSNPYENFLGIEELLDAVNCCDEYESEKGKILFTKTLLQMLDQSILGNALKSEDGMIYRGFRCGENSEVALPFYNKYIYYGVESLYSRCIWKAEYEIEKTKELFFGKIHALFKGMRNIAVSNGYLNLIISEKELLYNEQYFSDERGDLKFLIENKRFHIELDRRLENVERDIDICVSELIKL